MSSFNVDTTNAKPEFGIEDARIAITGISLISFMVGDFLVIMNSTPDVMLSDEPYLSLMVLVEMKSGKFIRRIWNRSVARGKTVTIEQLVDLCKQHFFQGKLCIGCPLYVNVEEGHDFVISQTPIPRKISRYCHEVLDGHANDKESSCPECLKLNESKDQTLVDVGTKCEAVIKSECEEWCDTNMVKSTLLMKNEETYPWQFISGQQEIKNEDMLAETTSEVCKRYPSSESNTINDNGWSQGALQELKIPPKSELNDLLAGQPTQGPQLSEADEQYACQVCKRIFKEIKLLCIHARDMHSINIKVKACTECGMAFYRKRELLSHMLVQHQIKTEEPSGGRPRAGSRGKLTKLTYRELITKAINNCDKKMLPLSGIYAFMSKENPNFKMEEKSWQNAVRHNLTLNTTFEKVPRKRGRGCLWAIKGGTHDIKDIEPVEDSLMTDNEDGVVEAGIYEKRGNNEIVSYTKDSILVNIGKGLGASKQIKCCMCEKEFGFKISLIKHAKDVHGLGNFNCTTCTFKALYVSKIVEHMQREHGEIASQEIECPSCKTNFEVSAISGHYKECIQFKDRLPVKCKWCDRIVLKRSIWEHEKAYHGRGKFVCPHCKLKATFSHELVKHMELENHGKDLDINCPSCKTSISMNEIVAHYKLCHRREHSRIKAMKKVVCKTCGKICNGNATYKTHMKTHMRAEGVNESETNIKLYHYCDKCERRFLYKGQLNDHVRSVHDKIDVTCKECPMTFKTLQAMYKHKILSHSTDERFGCKYCGKRFGSMANARSHERVHESPQFQCRFCSKLIKSEKTLEAHERSHTGEKAFTCKLCSAAFTSKNGLMQHEQGVHKIIGPKGGTGWLKQKKKDLS